jgi:hypothetical protein
LLNRNTATTASVLTSSLLRFKNKAKLIIQVMSCKNFILTKAISVYVKLLHLWCYLCLQCAEILKIWNSLVTLSVKNGKMKQRSRKSRIFSTHINQWLPGNICDHELFERTTQTGKKLWLLSWKLEPKDQFYMHHNSFHWFYFIYSFERRGAL